MANFVFIQRLWYEYPGIESICALLKKHGHSARVIIEDSQDKIANRLKSDDVAAFTVMTGMHHWAIQVASAIKQRSGSLTIFGGPHPTYFPEIINEPNIDMISIGESEYAVLELAQALDDKKDITNIKNIWVKKNNLVYKNALRPLISDLDSLPMPDRQVYYASYPSLKNSSHKVFLAGRGCPFDCTFCFNENLRKMYSGLGPYVRFRSPKNIIEEIQYVKKSYPLKTVFFNDDLFISNHKWLREFLPSYKEKIGLPFYACARADTIDDDIAKLLKESGCRVISFAIESGNEKIRNTLLAKRISDQQIIDAAAVLKKYKIKFATYNMVGIPGETLENMLETIALNIKIKTDYPRCSFLTPYPGTKIEQYARDMGYLETTANNILATSQQNQSLIKSRYKNETTNIHYFFQITILFPALFPVIKKLIRFTPNILFRICWMISYFAVFSASEGRNFTEMLFFSLNSFKSLSENKKSP